MPKRLQCPRGHQWEDTVDPRSEAKIPPSRCPVCGAAAEAKPPPALSTEAGTLLPTPPAAPGTPPLAVPERMDLPGYEVLELLGEGMMGQVYKARQVHLDRLVALKVIRANLLTDPEVLRRFQREAKAAARLSHPHVVSVYDAGESRGRHFLAMEYVEGTDLARMVRGRGPLPVALACDFTRQAALGLQHAHERGLVHRDLKPANLLVTSKGAVVKVLDLGLARLTTATRPGEQPSLLTQTGEMLGTPAFLAPEQAADSARADIRSDIYSLGCTLYFLLTARLPFFGSGVVDVILKHQLEKAAPLAVHRQDIPPGLQDVVSKTLAKRPEERYQTPAELAAALRLFCRKSSTAVPEKKPPSPPRAKGRWRFLILAAGAAAVLILGGLAWLKFPRPKPDVPIAGNPPLVVPPDHKGAVTCNNRGFAHFKKKEYPEAVADYTEAVRLDPQFAVAYNNRGLAYAAQGEHETAIEDYNKAIKLNAEYALAFTNRGDSYYEQKQYDRALQDYDEAINLDSKNAIARNNRGLAHAAKEDYERAIEDYSKAIQLDREFALAYYNRGIAYGKTGNAARAEADREKAVSLDPSLGN
ncbi:MAG TPA: serine/threonine-protein kinase [Gemmataceae bacterium]|jgi:serine/threonine protein kinase